MIVHLLNWASIGVVGGWSITAASAWFRQHRMSRKLLLDLRFILRRTSVLVLLSIGLWVLDLLWDGPITPWQFITRTVFIAGVATFWAWQHGWLDPVRDKELAKEYTYPPAGGKRKLS